MRIGGVSVGKVKDISLAPRQRVPDGPDHLQHDRATIEIDPQFAPISTDARAILRQKTLLGETYVELTTGTRSSLVRRPATPSAQSRDHRRRPALGRRRAAADPRGRPPRSDPVQDADPDRRDLQRLRRADAGRRSSAGCRTPRIAVNGRGLDLNDAFGNLGPFASRRQRRARHPAPPGAVTAQAGPRHGRRLRRAHRPRPGRWPARSSAANRTFGALASQSQALADTFQILPTFENEGRLTLDRLEDFAEDARPLFQDLRPVARDLSPTLRASASSRPRPAKLFRNLDPLTKASPDRASRRSSSFLRELRPVMDNLDPFLANLNPVVRWLDYQAPVVTRLPLQPVLGHVRVHALPAGQGAPLHLSRQMTIFTNESLSVYPHAAQHRTAATATCSPSRSAASSRRRRRRSSRATTATTPATSRAVAPSPAVWAAARSPAVRRRRRRPPRAVSSRSRRSLSPADAELH